MLKFDQYWLSMSFMNVSGQSSNSPVKEDIAAEAPVDELDQPIWTVISFDKCEASGLVYDEAVKRLGELDDRHIAGLCIVTNAAAERVASKKI